MIERPRFLADLAEEDRTLEAPRRVEIALRQRVLATRTLAWWQRLRWPAAATAALALAVIWMLFLGLPQAPTPVDVAAQSAPPIPAVARPAQTPVAALISAAPLKTARRALPRVAPVQERITRRFYSLAYAPPELLANSRILRVRVPRAALLSFGLPLSAYRAQDEKVAADVIYTEDGIARAIRFVENQE